MVNIEQVNEEKKKIIKAITEVCDETKNVLNDCVDKGVFYIEEGKNMRIPMYDYLNCVLDAIYDLKLKYLQLNKVAHTLNQSDKA